MLSHKLAITTAKQNDWPLVCIFEDDAYPVNGIVEKLGNYLSEIPDDCKVLILGYSLLMEKHQYNDKYMNNVSCWGSHAYVVFRECYDKYLKFMEKDGRADCF